MQPTLSSFCRAAAQFNQALAVYADVDQDGIYETLVVFNTNHGEAYPDYWPGWGMEYFFSPIDVHCGGLFPWSSSGQFAVWFVDALAPGFVATDPGTWTFKSVGGVTLWTVFDGCRVSTNETAMQYFKVAAYTERNQSGMLVNSYSHDVIPSTPEVDLTWRSEDGIKELYCRGASKAGQIL